MLLETQAASEKRSLEASAAVTLALRGMIEEHEGRYRTFVDEQGRRLDDAILALKTSSEEWMIGQSSLAKEVASQQEKFASEIRLLRGSLRTPVFKGGKNVLVTEVDGFIVGIPGEEWRLAAYLAFRGTTEPGLSRRFESLIKPGMVIIDVGAHVGMYTLYAARKLGAKGKIYSFEPTPRTFEFLRDNIQVNGFLESGIIKLHPAAVLDRRTSAVLRTYADNSGHNTLFHSGDGELANVPAVSLDEEIGAETVDVVKIDAEGAEPFVIRGMKEIIARNPRICIFLEFAPSHLQRAGIAPEVFYREIETLGFDISRVDDLTGDLSPVSWRELLSYHSSNLQLTLRDAEPAGEA